MCPPHKMWCPLCADILMEFNSPAWQDSMRSLKSLRSRDVGLRHLVLCCTAALVWHLFCVFRSFVPWHKISQPIPIMYTFCVFTLEIIDIRVKQSHHAFSEIRVQGEVHGFLPMAGGHHAGLLVFADSFFKKIGLSLKRDEFHKVKGVLCIIYFIIS